MLDMLDKAPQIISTQQFHLMLHIFLMGLLQVYTLQKDPRCLLALNNETITFFDPVAPMFFSVGQEQGRGLGLPKDSLHHNLLLSRFCRIIQQEHHATSAFVSQTTVIICKATKGPLSGNCRWSQQEAGGQQAFHTASQPSVYRKDCALYVARQKVRV